MSKLTKNILQADDIEIGMFITVHTGPTREIRTMSQTNFGSVTKVRDQNYEGSVLRVKSINFPFNLNTDNPHPL